MNLTETQITVKRGLFVVLLMTFIYYSGKFLLFTGISVYKQLFPKDLPPPTASFGKLPSLKMPTYKILGKPTYTLDTETGSLPNFSDRINVYKLVKPTPNLLAESKVKDLATSLGFNSGFTKKNISEFRWIDGNAERTMDADVITKNFIVKTKMSKLGSILSTTNTITEKDATDIALGFIRANALLQQDELSSVRVTTIPTIVNLSKYQDMNRFLRQAKIIKVNVYRSITQPIPFTKEKSTYEVLGPNPKNSLISFYISNHKDIFKYPEINFTHWSIDFKNKSTYPISDIGAVWNTIQQGQGIVAYTKLSESGYYANYEPITFDEIRIKKVYIAYYEPYNYTPYLQPIYVFEGTFKTIRETGTLAKKGDIIIYYPAIAGDFVKPIPLKKEKKIIEKTPVKIIDPRSNGIQ